MWALPQGGVKGRSLAPLADLQPPQAGLLHGEGDGSPYGVFFLLNTPPLPSRQWDERLDSLHLPLGSSFSH